MDTVAPALRYPHPTPPAEGEAVTLASGVLWMRLPLPMALDHVNVFALREKDGWTLIDTGFSSRRGRAIWAKLLEGPLEGRPIVNVVATHHHPDHIGLAGWFQATHGARLWTSRTAWLMARMLQLDEQDRPNPETLAFWRAAGMDRRSWPSVWPSVRSILPIPSRHCRWGFAICGPGRWCALVGAIGMCGWGRAMRPIM